MDTGYKTLELMDRMDKYNYWVFGMFAGYVKGKIMEVGCGIGSITSLYVGKFDVTCIDISTEYIKIINKRFSEFKNFHAMTFDIEQCDSKIFEEASYDTIICSNVLEHIRNDFSALLNMNRLLKPDGILILLVPAMNFLYNNMDKTVGHYRRYTTKKINPLLQNAGFKIEKQFYINLIGAVGWFTSGKIFKRAELPKTLSSIYNWFVPIISFAESRIKLPFGLSLVNICKRKNS